MVKCFTIRFMATFFASLMNPTAPDSPQPAMTKLCQWPHAYPVFRLSVFILGLGLGLPTNSALARALPDPAEQPRSLLEQHWDDPLLPNLRIPRPLSPLEAATLTTQVEALQEQAAMAQAQGDRTQAFDLWFRALRLQRFLGVDEEIVALGLVAQQAWQARRTAELGAIVDRLAAIEANLTQTQDLTLARGEALGKAYQQARQLALAKQLYLGLLNQAQNSQEIATNLTLLNHLVEVAWGSLNYQEAAYYREAQLQIFDDQPVTRSNLLEEQSLLQSLVFLYEESHNLSQKSDRLTDLLNLTLDLGHEHQVAAIQLDLADTQVALGNLEQADRYYRQAYRQAQTQQQIDLAQTILQRLGNLQEQQGHLSEAIATYDVLRQVQRHSSNLLGLLESYDRLGTLYLQMGQPQTALTHYQAGLALAERLQYRIQDFTQALTQLTPTAPPDQIPMTPSP